MQTIKQTKYVKLNTIKACQIFQDVNWLEF